MPLSKALKRTLERLAYARTDAAWQGALREARRRQITVAELRARLPRYEERAGIPTAERNSRFRPLEDVAPAETAPSRVHTRQTASATAENRPSRRRLRTRRATRALSSEGDERDGGGGPVEEGADEVASSGSSASRSVSLHGVDSAWEGAAASSGGSSSSRASREETEAPGSNGSNLEVAEEARRAFEARGPLGGPLSPEQMANVSKWRAELSALQREADLIMEVAGCIPAPEAEASEDATPTDTRSAAERLAAVLQETSAERADGTLLARAAQLIEDLQCIERRRERLLQRAERHRREKLAYLQKYRDACRKQADDEMCVSKEEIREQMVAAAEVAERRRRLAAYWQRDPMIMQAEPPLAMAPGVAGGGISYALAPTPATVATQTAALMNAYGGAPEYAGMSWEGAAAAAPGEWVLLERQPVHLTADAAEAEDDLRLIQKSVSALKRRLRARAQYANAKAMQAAAAAAAAAAASTASTGTAAAGSGRTAGSGRGRGGAGRGRGRGRGVRRSREATPAPAKLAPVGPTPPAPVIEPGEQAADGISDDRNGTAEERASQASKRRRGEDDAATAGDAASEGDERSVAEERSDKAEERGEPAEESAAETEAETPAIAAVDAVRDVPAPPEAEASPPKTLDTADERASSTAWIRFPSGGDPEAHAVRGTLHYRGRQLGRGDVVAVRVLPPDGTDSDGPPEYHRGPITLVNAKEVRLAAAEEYRVQLAWLQNGHAELVPLEPDHEAGRGAAEGSDG